MPKKFRGSGFKHTLPAVMPVSTLWFIVMVIAVPIMVVFMLLGGLVADSMRGDLMFFLATRMPVIALAVGALAVFTTTRVAGPYIALRRAFEDVKNGDFDRQLSLRRGDKHLRELEATFNEMMSSIRDRVNG